MKLRAPRLCLLLVLLALLVPLPPTEAGQTSGPGGPPPPPPPPGPLADAVFGEIVAGHFTSDLDPDAVVLDDGVPTLLMAPESFQTSVRGPASTNDLALLPGDAGTDRLLIVGAGGFQEMVWDDGASTWAPDDHDTSSSWIDARAIATGELDGGVGLDVVALTAEIVDPGGVLIQHANGTGGFDPALGFSTFMPAYDLLTMDWEGDGTDEIVALSDWGVEVWEPEEEYVADLPWSVSTLVAAVIDDRGVAERLAVIASNATGTNQWLMLFDASGVEGPFNLGNLGAVRAIAGDLDGDLDDDLVLTTTTGPEYVTLTYYSDLEQSDPADPSFDLTFGMAFVPFGDPSRDPSTNAAGAAIADFDHDGDADVLAPAQGDYTGGPAWNKILSEVVLSRGTIEDESEQQVRVAGSRLLWDVEGPDPDLEITLGGPIKTIGIGDQDVRLEITVWRTPDLWEPTDSVPFIPQLLVDVPAAEDEKPIVISLAGAVGLYPFPELFTYVIRQAILEEGVVVDRGPAVTVVYASDENFEDVQGQLPNIQNIIITIPYNPNGSSWPGGGMVVGPSVPRHDDDDAAMR